MSSQTLDDVPEKNSVKKIAVYVSLAALVLGFFCGLKLKRPQPPCDPVEVFLNDPAAFKDFLHDAQTIKAIHSSPTLRRIFVENGQTAQAFLNKVIAKPASEVKNRPLADKAIALLKNDPVRFQKFFEDPQVATEIIELDQSFDLIELQISALDKKSNSNSPTL